MRNRFVLGAQLNVTPDASIGLVRDPFFPADRLMNLGHDFFRQLLKKPDKQLFFAAEKMVKSRLGYPGQLHQFQDGRFLESLGRKQLQGSEKHFVPGTCGHLGGVEQRLLQLNPSRSIPVRTGIIKQNRVYCQ
jgi:hypothetical protein